MEKVVGGAIVALGVIALMVVTILWGGFVLQHVWNWHAVAFTSIRLTLAQAIGLSCLLSLLKGLKRTKDSGEEHSGVKDLSFIFTAYGFTLLTAWLAHVFA